jgi:hypothetical protein
MSVAEGLDRVKKNLPEHCVLVAVSKTKPVEILQQAYDHGHRDFGENKVQEMVEKSEALPKDIRWHMIGHLQRNKVKYIAPFVHLIHGVDSLRLLKEIQKQGMKYERVLDCLLQIHIAREETKFGFDAEEINGELLQAIGTLSHVRIRGLMGMATFTHDEGRIREEFKYLHDLYQQLSEQPSPNNFEMSILSMGMSNDYSIALEEGSNMIRVGSLIFGPRD